MIDKIEGGLSYTPSGFIDAQIEWAIEETQEEISLLDLNVLTQM